MCLKIVNDAIPANDRSVQKVSLRADACAGQFQHFDALCRSQIIEDAALGSRRGDEPPEELKRREERLAKIREAKARVGSRGPRQGGRRTTLP